MSEPTYPPLPKRYQIRKLNKEDHLDWTRAIIAHAFVFRSPLMIQTRPAGMTQLDHFWAFFHSLEDDMRHKLSSGMSFGIFDLEHQFKNPRSEQTGGKSWPDSSESHNPNMTSTDLLDTMDFPLVSVAPSSNTPNPRSAANFDLISAAIPAFRTLTLELAKNVKHQIPSDKKVLRRGGTATRADYEGQGLMKALAHFVIHEAAREGYDGVQITPTHTAACHVWENPPSPYTVVIVSSCETESVVEGLDLAQIKVETVYVDLTGDKST